MVISKLIFILFFISFACHAQVPVSPQPQSKSIKKEQAPHKCGQFDFLCDAVQKLKQSCTGKKGEAYEKCLNETQLDLDCKKAQDHDYCLVTKAILDKGQKTCKGKEGEELDQCWNDLDFDIDCSQARNHDQCIFVKQEMNRMQQNCKGKKGKDYDECIENHEIDCDQTPYPETCKTLIQIKGTAEKGCKVKKELLFQIAYEKI